MSGEWTAIVLAGQRPGENDFAEAHGTKWKALIPVGGEAMLGRVVRVLLGVAPIGRIVILAQDPHSLMTGDLAWMAAEPRIAIAVSGDSISRSIAAIAGSAAAPFPLLLTTADHALLTGAMVEAFLDGAGESDAAVALVERSIVEAAYPETRRTWLRFSDGDYSGANLFALRTAKARKSLEMWAEVERDRKKALRLLMSFGPMLALRALTRTISLDRALAIAGRRAGFSVRAVRLPFAEAAIDVDKPADLALAERILAARLRSGGAAQGDGEA